MKKYLLVSAISLLTTLQAHAERAETYVPQNKLMAKSAATTSAFLGAGKQSFSLNVPEIDIDLRPTSSGLKTTGAIYHLLRRLWLHSFHGNALMAVMLPV